MRARLYRGPHDGRVLEVPDIQRAITLKRKGKMTLRPMSNDNGYFVIPTIDDEYHIVLARMPDGKLGFSVHPDGSVYFEWSKPRGTRIER